MPVEGGSPIRITRNGGISPVESPEGRYLYYSKYEQGGVWRVPLPGGQEAEVLKDVDGGAWPNWGVNADGIYFLKFGKFPLVTIDFFEFATGKAIPVLDSGERTGLGPELVGRRQVHCLYSE